MRITATTAWCNTEIIKPIDLLVTSSTASARISYGFLNVIYLGRHPELQLIQGF